MDIPFAAFRPQWRGRKLSGPALKKDLWYRVRPDGLDENGTCWLVGYGVKERVSVVDFEFRRLE